MKKYVVDYDKVYTESEIYDSFLRMKAEGEQITAGLNFCEFLKRCQEDGSAVPVNPETMLYDTERGEVVYIDDLRAEFNTLKESDPETYDYTFPEYLENCLSATLERFPE